MRSDVQHAAHRAEAAQVPQNGGALLGGGRPQKYERRENAQGREPQGPLFQFFRGCLHSAQPEEPAPGGQVRGGRHPGNNLSLRARRTDIIFSQSSRSALRTAQARMAAPARTAVAVLSALRELCENTIRSWWPL